MMMDREDTLEYLHSLPFSRQLSQYDELSELTRWWGKPDIEKNEATLQKLVDVCRVFKLTS